jgi:hypothetical protein
MENEHQRKVLVNLRWHDYYDSEEHINEVFTKVKPPMKII